MEISRYFALLPVALLSCGMVVQSLAQETVEAEVAEVHEVVEAETAAAADVPEEVPAPPSDVAADDKDIAEMTSIVEGVQDAQPAEQRPPPMADAGADAQVQALMKELSKRQQELDKANAELARLRAVVREMLSANRTEQFVMHYNMACVYKNQGQYGKAEEHFLIALEKRPNEPDVHYNLGILYDDDLNDIAKARKHYQRFIELAPKDEDAAQVQEWLLSLGK